MNIFLASLLLLLTMTACNTQKPATETQSESQQAPAVGQKQRDISTETLVALDPDIQAYADKVAVTKTAYDNDGSSDSRKALLDAYIAFGDYMQYNSPVSPRQGKYHRALVEYRQALELDPANSKVQGEIAQIEGIYKSMGRPIPGS